MRPTRLYVAADGPRESRPAESIFCEEVRSIFKSIDWDCEIKTLYRDKNIGCRLAVSKGIDWFFENEEEGIILEDDCLPSEDFFRFCSIMLNEYRNHTRIMHISGTNFIPFIDKTEKRNIYFSRYPQVWGWATWRRAWKEYLRDPDIWNQEAISPWKNSPTQVQRFWKQHFGKAYAGNIDTWDFQWVYTLNILNAFAINPPINLVQNIGFGIQSSHTNSTNDPRGKIGVGELPKEILSPSVIVRNENFDLYIESKYFSSSSWIRKVVTYIIRKINF
ncbi:glycosyl transferase [Leptospira sp. WS92.C1]